MTKEEILLYLDNKDAAKSRDARLTRIYIGKKNIALANFYKKDQKAELIEKNQWIIYALDNLKDPLVIDGNEITDLKSGR